MQILFAEKDETIKEKYSAIMQPIEAAIVFSASTLINITAGVGITNLANKGKLESILNPDNLKNCPDRLERLNKFKNRAFVVITLLSIPFVSKFLTWLYPKIVNNLPKLCEKFGCIEDNK
ncbi:MAG: hypothetical protein MZU97_09085 [Bacillus subtilis]|nr:hypothetical protein [Bacillus subtilis]